MDTNDIPGMHGFDEFVAALMAETRTPGLGLAVVRDGKVLVAKGYGVRDVDTGQPVTADTLFAIGSSSKAFASTCLGMLADEGKLDWDTPLRNYIPDLRMFDPVTTDRVTARDICCHRTGVPGHDLYIMDSKISRKEMVAGLRYLQPNKELRATWQYQNHMFALAAYLPEVLIGRTWEDMVRERIFGPLHMSTSNFSPRVARTMPDWAEPHKEADGRLVKIPARELLAEAPAGGIYSSPREMANWVLLHLGEGEFEGKRLVSEAQMREMHSRQMLIPDAATALLTMWGEAGPGSYGLGWATYTYRGRDIVEHGGNIDGFNSMVTMMPRERLGIVILVNRGSTLPTILPYGIYERLLGLSVTDWFARFKEIMGQMAGQTQAARDAAEARGKKGTQPSHPLDDYVGDYAHPGYGVLSVTRDGEGLKVRRNEVSFALKHVHYDVFEFEYPALGITFRLAFHSDNDGDIGGVTIPFEPSVKDILHTRVAGKAMSEASFLEAFVGEYELMGMTARVSLKGGALILSVPGQGDSELTPSKGDAFKLKEMPSIGVEFKRDAAGKVIEVMLNQPNGSFIAKRKG